jgi:RHS repeat-associated protein
MEVFKLLKKSLFKLLSVACLYYSGCYSVVSKPAISKNAHYLEIQQQWADMVSKKSNLANIDLLDKKTIQSSSADKPSYSTGYLTPSIFEEKLNAFNQRLKQLIAKSSLSKSQIQSLFVSYEDLQAVHLVFNQQYNTQISKLKTANLEASFEYKVTQSKNAYEVKMAKILSHLAPLQSKYQGKLNQGQNALETLVADASFQSQLKNLIEITTQALTIEIVDKPVRILRNNLPYRQSETTRRYPTTTVSIVPSYQSSQTPTSEDLNTSDEAPLSEIILKKAEALEHDYIKIYDFVHNQIKTEWYVGASKGAEGTLLQMSGNDVDQASLLIALFRASGLASRYVHGIIELPYETVNASLGLTNSAQAVEVLNAAGVAYSSVIRGGKIAAFELEYTWVSAYIPYNNYRGAVVDRSGEQWLPLMPSIKAYEIEPARNILEKAGLNVDSSISNYLASLQTASLKTQLIESISYYLAGNPSEAPLEEQLGSITIAPSEIGLIPNTLPVVVIAVINEESELSSMYQQKIRFITRNSLGDNDQILMDRTIAMSQVVNRRLTLSYMPASIDDHNLTNLYGGLDLVPSYLINLRPELKLNGKKLFTAEGEIGAGINHRFDVEIITPAGTQTLKHTLLSGSYHALSIATGENTFAEVENDPADTEYLGARILANLGQEYNKAWTQSEVEIAKLLNVAVVKPFPSLNIVSNDLKVETVLGEPQQLKWQAVTLDAGFRMAHSIGRVEVATSDSTPEVIAQNKLIAQQNAKDFIRLTALEGSTLEHEIFEDLFKVDSVSADKGIQTARSLGQTVFTINLDNSSALISQLEQPTNVIEDIQSWVSKGFQVTVPQSSININSWSGSVWIVEDLESGDSGYFIGGGLAGGSTTIAAGQWVLEWLQDAIEAANSPEPNSGTNSVVSITKYLDNGYVNSVVGKTEERFTVLVRDKKGLPVQGAQVNFVTTGEGSLDNELVLSDEHGFASVNLTNGTSTDVNPIYQRQNEDDEYLAKASLSGLTAFVSTDKGKIALLEPFYIIAFPDIPIKLIDVGNIDLYGLPLGSRQVMAFLAHDQYGNVVSNVDVNISMGLTYSACPIVNNVYEEAPLPSAEAGWISSLNYDIEGESINFKTNTYPSLFQANFGRNSGTTYPVTVTGANNNLNYDFKVLLVCSGDNSSFLTTFKRRDSGYINSKGKSFVAAKVGEKVKGKFGGKYILSKNGDYIGDYYEQAEDLPSDWLDHADNWSSIPLDGEGRYVADFGATVTTSREEDYYDVAEITVGPTPVKHTVNLQLTINKNWVVYDDIYEKGDEVNYGELDAIYAVDTFVTSFGDNISTDFIHLSQSNHTDHVSSIEYQILPSDYEGILVDVDIFQSNELYRSFIGTNLFDKGKVKLPIGLYFDPEKTYTAQVVLNRRSPYEIKSDHKVLDFSKEIILNYSKAISLSHDIDLANGLQCFETKGYSFELSEEAKVTLEVDGNKLIDNIVYPKGKHSIPLSPDEVLPRTEPIISNITAISTRTGLSEDKNGQIKVQLASRNNLPVGHTLVKGVDVATGNLTVSSTDLSIPARAQPFELQRYYSSNGSLIPGNLGVGWGHSLSSNIDINSCGVVTINGGTGGVNRFIADENGDLQPLKGYHGLLIPVEPEGSFDFFARDGTRYHYKNYGRSTWDLEYIEDTNGNQTKFTYDGNFIEKAKLLSVEASDGRLFNFNYVRKLFEATTGLPEEYDVIESIEFSAGVTIKYDYDEFGNLISANHNGGRSEFYAYSIENDLNALKHKLTTYTDPNGNDTSYSYNDEVKSIMYEGVTLISMPYSKVLGVNEPTGTTTFDLDNQGRVTNARGFVTTYSTNDYGAVTSINRPISGTQTEWAEDDILVTSTTDGNGNTTKYSYDTYGNRTEVSRPGNIITETKYHPTTKFSAGSERAVKNRVASVKDANGYTTNFDYDRAGNLTEIKYPDGGVVKHSYNDSGDRMSTTDANGNITRYGYDDYGNVILITDALGNNIAIERDSFGLPLSEIDANGNTTENSFDGLQRLISTKDALNGTTSFTYDPVGNKLSETDPNGNETSFTFDKGYRLTRITNATGDFMSTDYDSMSNKINQTDFNGNTTSYSYDGNDRVTSMSQPESRSFTFEYDGVGNKISEILGDQSKSFIYDALNRLTVTRAPLEATTTTSYDGVGNVIAQTDPLGRKITFKYDPMNRMIKRTQPIGRVDSFAYDLNGNKISETDGNGTKRSFKYDKANRLEEYTDGNGNTSTSVYDGVGNITSSINARLNAMLFEYDSLNRKTKTTDAKGVSTSFVYDAVGNLTELQMPNGNTVTNVYDVLNRLTASNDSLGTLTTKTYDANNNVITKTDAKGNGSTLVYDGLNRVIETLLPENRSFKSTYDIYNNKTTDTDANANVTSYEFDALNRLTKTTQPEGVTSSLTYDLAGNKLTQIDPLGNTTSFTYDALNQLTKITDPLSQSISITYDSVGNKLTETDKKGTSVTYTYDKENRMLTTVKAGLKLITLEYDAVGNKAFETDANGNRSAFIYNKVDQLTTQSHPLAAISVFEYDDMGNQTSARDPEGRTSRFTYDLRNRLLTSSNGNSETTTLTYDGNGNQLTKQSPEGNVWSTVYDNANRPTSISAPDGGTTEYTYDANSNRLTQQNALGQTTRFVYDSLNRQTSMTYPGGVAVSSEYDANGNRTTFTDANGKVFVSAFDNLNRKILSNYPASNEPSSNDILSISYDYDANNNLLNVTEVFRSESGTNNITRTTSNLYDEFDRKTSVNNGDSKNLSYSYDANGNRKTVTDADDIVTRYNYDDLNRVINVLNSQGVTAYQYDRSSLQTQVSYPNGTQAKTSYDGAGRTQSISNLQDGAIISKFDYVLDSNGNRTQQTETQGALVEVTDYVYDSNDRLTQTIVSGAQDSGTSPETTNYTYDSNYNRLTEVKSVNAVQTVNRALTYNVRGQVTRVTDNIDSANSADYTYDNNGNRIQKVSTALTETYLYDVRDQLKEIKQGGSTIGQFLYDYQGLRVEKTTTDISDTSPDATPVIDTKKYVYDDQSVLMQLDESGVTLSKYDYGSNRLLSMNNVVEGAQFYLFDALGSPVNLTKSDGTVQARYQYDAFGNARSQTGESANVFGFTGHEKDEETGLYYFKARYYDPTLGQFLTQDAFEGMTDTPPSLHKYIYAYGNPTVWVDPDGNKSIFGDATKQLEKFRNWLGEQNKAGDSKLAAVAIGTAKFVTRLGEGITRPLDVAANVAQEAVGVDDQQVRDELAATRRMVTNGIDFAVNGDYVQAAKNLHGAAVGETVKAMQGDVNALSNLTEGGLSIALLKNGIKNKPKVVKENSSGANVVLQTEAKSLNNIKNNVETSKNLNDKINKNGIVYDVKQAAKEAVRKTDVEGVTSANGRRGIRAHKILEESVPAINERYRGTGYGAQAEQFRLPSPDGVKPGAPARTRQKDSRGLDVVITKDTVPVKGMDLKTGKAKFSDEFKKDLRVRFKLKEIEEIKIK